MCQFCPYARANEFNTLDGRILIDRFVDHANNFVTQFLASGTDRRWHTHHHVTAAAKVLNNRVLEPGFFQRIAHQIEVGRLFQADFNDGTASEVQTPVKTTHRHNGD
ncbi:hypothetical protein D3C78_999620 [compost metagenome]